MKQRQLAPRIDLQRHLRPSHRQEVPAVVAALCERRQMLLLRR